MTQDRDRDSKPQGRDRESKRVDYSTPAMGTFWRGSSQDKWKELSRKVVDEAVVLLQKSISFDDLYEFLVNKRCDIARELNQTGRIPIEDIKFNRAETPIKDKNKIIKTRIDPSSARMGSFYQDLKKLFDETNPEEIKSGTVLRGTQITYKGIEYSRLFELSESVIFSEPTFMIVEHTETCENIKQAILEAKNLFTELQTDSTKLSDIEKIKKLKEMLWHLAQGMRQGRGSASINEWLLEALLVFHKINFEPNTNIPFDLIALFTSSPEKFAEKFCINCGIEQKIRFDQFKSEYQKQYESEFFKNPFSKMKKMLENGSMHSIEEVEKYAKEHPDTRTTEVLNKLRKK